MLSDARRVPGGTTLEADVVVVGAGPAGISLCVRLLGSGLRVLLLESGGTDPTAAHQALFRGEVAGHDYPALDTCRFRMFGGSTNRWGGWCRPLERTDFEARAWIAGSGWPITAADLEPYHQDAAELFGLPFLQLDPAAWGDRLPAPLPLGPDTFRSGIFQYCEETAFGDAHGPRLAASSDVQVLLHANVTDLRLGAGPAAGRVERVRVQTLAGTRLEVRGRAVVLAGGGIENARILLAARADRPAGLGNEHDLVGRCFMEHLHVPAGHLVLASADAERGFYRKALRDGARLRGVLIPHAHAQARLGLLGTSIALEDGRFHYGTPFLGWSPRVTVPPVRLFRRVRESPARRLGLKAKGVAEAAWNTRREWQTGRAARHARARVGIPVDPRLVRSLYFRSEQVPDRSSRVTLGAGTDRFGTPVPRLDWKVGEGDLASIRGWLDVLAREAVVTGVGEVVGPADGWEDLVIGGPHHMGTTRMSARPEDGVVDADARVHSVENLYVAGSSVFTTGGFSNPTFTLVTLALRLGDHLARTLRV